MSTSNYTLSDDQIDLEIVLADLPETLLDYARDVATPDELVACEEVLTGNGLGLHVRDLDHANEICRRVNKILGRETTGWVVNEATRDAKELAHEVAAIVGDDGTGDLRVIVDCALRDDPAVTVDEIVEIVREARAEAAGEVQS